MGKKRLDDSLMAVELWNSQDNFGTMAFRRDQFFLGPISFLGINLDANLAGNSEGICPLITHCLGW